MDIRQQGTNRLNIKKQSLGNVQPLPLLSRPPKNLRSKSQLLNKVTNIIHLKDKLQPSINATQNSVFIQESGDQCQPPKNFHKHRIINQNISNSSGGSTKSSNSNMISNKLSEIPLQIQEIDDSVCYNQFNEAIFNKNNQYHVETSSIFSDKLNLEDMQEYQLRQTDAFRTQMTQHYKSISNYEDDCDTCTQNSPFDSPDEWGSGYTFEDFENLLPCKIENFKLKKLTWENFSAIPDENSRWRAHTFWQIRYTYDIRMRKMKRSNNIRYRLIINSWAHLLERSWVKNKWPRLLEHETGHYLIGCLCALEFKKKADKEKYSKNYRMEVQKIFSQTFQEYVQLEKKYDDETEHSRNIPKQKEWNRYIIEQITEYTEYYANEKKKVQLFIQKK